MKKTKADYDTRVFANMECKHHPRQSSRFYCSNLDCRTPFCRICLKEHSREHHLATTTIEDVKEKALISLESEIESKLRKTLQTILQSDKMNVMFKEVFFTLMQQNPAMKLDAQAVAGLVADTLAKKYFPQEISIPQMTEKNHTLDLEGRYLLSFDFKYDTYDDDDENNSNLGDDSDNESEDTRNWYEKYQRKFSDKSSKFYGRNPLKSLHLKSKDETILWNAQYQKLYHSKEDKKYTIPLPFNSLVALDLKEELLVFATAGTSLYVYSLPKEKDDPSLKLLKEIPHKDQIIFIESDSKALLFAVSVTLEATLCLLTDELELKELASFRLSDAPKRVVIDRLNGLLFIEYSDTLEIYRHIEKTPRLIKRFSDSVDFSWHPMTRRLLFLSLGELFQFDKGKFRLSRVIDSIECKCLTEFGILGIDTKENLCLLSLKNPTKKRFLPRPSFAKQRDLLQTQRYNELEDLDDNAEPWYDDLKHSFKSIKLVAEGPTYLLIYLNVDSHQGARQKAIGDDDQYEIFGGTVFTQWLLQYDLKKEKYEFSYQ